MSLSVECLQPVAYHHERSSIREAYEELFAPMDPRDAREVTVHRVVNIVEKRNTSSVPWQGTQYERGYDEDPHYGGPRNYSSARGYYKEDRFLPNDSRYFDENPNHENFRKNSPPHRNQEGSYSQQYYGRDDLRHQLSSRNRSRGHYPRKRGRGLGPSPRENRDDYRTSKSLVITRDRSPSKREAQPPSRSRSNSSNRSFSPDRDKGYTYQQQQQQMHCTEKPSAVKSQTPSSSAEGSPHSSVSSKEKPSTSAAAAAAAEAAASVEPELTPEEDIKARRWEAINAKVLEIEKHYSQDCETFRTVVKMLVAKEPSLETLLQAPLDQNLFEIRQRCLDALKSFVTELDEILEQPHTSE